MDESFLTTYARNIHPVTVCGDIRRTEIVEGILSIVGKFRSPNKPLFVVGGPPCQGFSTAGKRRTLTDERNHLFSEFKSLVQKLQPDGFIFENVPGLLNMEKGRVFEMIRSELELPKNRLVAWILHSERFGIPQRRSRLFLLSLPASWPGILAPALKTKLGMEDSLFGTESPAISVSEALSDLPSLQPGEDGSNKDYVSPPRNSYQQLMRGFLTPADYLRSLGRPEQ